MIFKILYPANPVLYCVFRFLEFVNVIRLYQSNAFIYQIPEINVVFNNGAEKVFDFEIWSISTRGGYYGEAYNITLAENSFSTIAPNWSEPELSDIKMLIYNNIDGIYEDTISLEIQLQYTCGDANSDGIINVADAVFLINTVFRNGPLPVPYESGNVNCDGTVNVSDAVYLINHVFRGGPAPCEGCE